jgi:hypothetical protein
MLITKTRQFAMADLKERHIVIVGMSEPPLLREDTDGK